jgi:hypothetical protein
MATRPAAGSTKLGPFQFACTLSYGDSRWRGSSLHDNVPPTLPWNKAGRGAPNHLASRTHLDN